MKKTTASYAPLPGRAVRDQRLHNHGMAVLAAVAYHDRLTAAGRVGSGCFASNSTLAREVGIDRSSLSVWLGKLETWGYITSEAMPLNKRMRVRRVIYRDDDRLEQRRVTPSAGVAVTPPVTVTETPPGATAAEPAARAGETAPKPPQRPARRLYGIRDDPYADEQPLPRRALRALPSARDLLYGKRQS